jgi:hypothetical protein
MEDAPDLWECAGSKDVIFSRHITGTREYGVREKGTKFVVMNQERPSKGARREEGVRKEGQMWEELKIREFI